jgi:hypothetical protein
MGTTDRNGVVATQFQTPPFWQLFHPILAEQSRTEVSPNLSIDSLLEVGELHSESGSEMEAAQHGHPLCARVNTWARLREIGYEGVESDEGWRVLESFDGCLERDTVYKPRCEMGASDCKKGGHLAKSVPDKTRYYS